MTTTLEELWEKECSFARSLTIPRSKKALRQLIHHDTYISPEIEDELVRYMIETEFFFYDDLVDKFQVTRSFINHLRIRYKLPPIKGKCIKKHQNVLKIDGLRKCPTCKEVKDLETEWYSGKRVHCCISCEKLRHKLSYPETSTRHLLSLDTFLTKKLKDSEKRFEKLKNRNSDMFHTLTIQELINLYNNQNGKCFYTGRQLELALSKDNKNALSIDRMNSSKGYTIDNVVLCCSIVNVMKMDSSLEDFRNICQEIVQLINPQ